MSKLPKINAYRCQYGCNMTTVDVDEDVTPFSIKCRTKARPDRPLNPALTDKNGECVGMSNSSFYPKIPLPPYLKAPLWEWRKQSEETYQYAAQRYDITIEEVRESYKTTPTQLMLMPRTEREPLYHEL